MLYFCTIKTFCFFICIIEDILKRNEMTTTQTLALAYAEKLVAYYETINNRDENRIAYMEMCNAQNALAFEAQAEAETKV